jgi:hypothetical protein
VTDADSYIALRPGDTPGELDAVLIPAGTSPRDAGELIVRSIRTQRELAELRAEWGIDDVRGADPSVLDRDA